MIRFIHTSDWQLGMTRRFLNQGAQERFDAARCAAIRKIGAVARDHDCRFVVVAGDVYESNQVGRKTLVRSLDAMREADAAFYLLPGNHDPLDYASVYQNPVFLEHCPANVHVVTNHEPIIVLPGILLIGAPWPAKRVAVNPLDAALKALTEDPASPAGDDGIMRIVLAHGPVDGQGEFPDTAAVIRLATLNSVLRAGLVHYVCLGDRHSRTVMGDGDRVCYSGTPEATAFREIDPGWVNLVTLDPVTGAASSRPERVGQWHFRDLACELARPEDVTTLSDQLAAMTDKETSIVQLRLTGLLGLADIDRLDAFLAHYADLFASFEVEREQLHTSVATDENGLARFSGFAAEAALQLRAMASGGGERAATARDALLLLMRLGGIGKNGDTEATE